jgi:hypothetical protein
MAKRKGARRAADKKIADVIEGKLGDLDKAEELFDGLSKVAGNKFRERMRRVKRVIKERRAKQL